MKHGKFLNSILSGHFRSSLPSAKRHCCSHGSLSVEAVFLIPLVLLIFFFILSFAFYMHQRIWFTAAAYEAVLTEGSEEFKAKLALTESVLTVDTPTAEVRCSPYHAQVTYRGTIFSLFGNYRLNYKAEAAIERPNPVRQIRFIRLLM